MSGVVRDMIDDEMPKKKEQATSGSVPTERPRRRNDTVAASLSPLLDAEKTDVQFWLDVATVVLLFLILLELRG